MRHIGLDFACNDPDNGLFSGRVDGIQLYAEDPIFELEARRETGPRLSVSDGSIRLAGKSWPISSSKEWVGNWCWNRYAFPLERAADFLIWLHARKLFALTCGDSRLYDAWRSVRGLGAFRPLLLILLSEAADHAASRRQGCRP